MLIASYAKINLSLEVLGKLPDNYHQINTVFCSIDLHDTIRIALTKTAHVKMWSNVPEMVSDDNLICQIAMYLKNTFKPLYGAEIFLDKRIPIAAGLGGGSSNAAVTLMALNHLWSLQLDMKQMTEIASSFGSDMVYFLHGGMARGLHRGEIIEPMADLPLRNILLVNPNIKISSKEAYDLVEISQESIASSSQAAAFRYVNSLEHGIRQKYNVVDEVLISFNAFKAQIALMSGSGSTCFGIFSDELSLRACQEYFDGIGYWTKRVKTISKKEYKECFQSLN
jgi:4-diphosphocytidyl-2-C-methyl-D-erythritol kinase